MAGADDAAGSMMPVGHKRKQPANTPVLGVHSTVLLDKRRVCAALASIQRITCRVHSTETGSWVNWPITSKSYGSIWTGYGPITNLHIQYA